MRASIAGTGATRPAFLSRGKHASLNRAGADPTLRRAAVFTALAALAFAATPRLDAQDVEVERDSAPADPEELLADLLPPLEILEDMDEAGYPLEVESIGPRSGLGVVFGVERFDPFFLEVGYSIRGSQRHRAGLLFGGEEKRGLRLGYTFRRDAEDTFWGVGSELPDDRRSDFLRDKSETSVEAWTRLRPRVRLAGGIAFEDNRVARGGDANLPDVHDTFASDPVFGISQRVKLLRLEMAVALDRVFFTGFQRRGLWLQFGAAAFRGVDGTDSDFHRFLGESRYYLPLGSKAMFAVRGLVEMNRLDSGEGIPFFDLSRMGGSRNGPRSFSGGRFRDRDGLSLMTELRREILKFDNRRLQGFVFLDQGGVTRNLGSISGSDLHTSYGLGLRLTDREGFATIGYAAFGEEGVRLGLRTHWPF